MEDIHPRGGSFHPFPTFSHRTLRDPLLPPLECPECLDRGLCCGVCHASGAGGARHPRSPSACCRGPADGAADTEDVGEQPRILCPAPLCHRILSSSKALRNHWEKEHMDRGPLSPSLYPNSQEGAYLSSPICLGTACEVPWPIPCPGCPPTPGARRLSHSGLVMHWGWEHSHSLSNVEPGVFDAQA